MQKVVAREGEPLNVLLIVTDSTRRDFVSIYDGDKLADTPNLDALGKEGLLFNRAVPEAMPTVAVRRALLTGTRSFPFRDWKVGAEAAAVPRLEPDPRLQADLHGVPRRRRHRDRVRDRQPVPDRPALRALSRHARHLQADLRAGGVPRLEHGRGPDKVATKAQIENYLLPALAGTEAEERIKENIGYNRGRKGDQLSGARVLKAGMEVLRQLKDKQPFFLGVDAFDPHEAWNVPTAFKLRFRDRKGVEPILPFKTPYSKVEDLEVTEDQVQQVRELYAGELTYIDAWIGRLLNLLDDLGLADRTVVYYLSDHGILLGEHGLIGKANSMLGREIHQVPYMIRHPEGKRAGETSDYFVSTHDVAPSILSFQGLTSRGRWRARTSASCSREPTRRSATTGRPPTRTTWPRATAAGS